jgi:competence protein ComGC
MPESLDTVQTTPPPSVASSTPNTPTAPVGSLPGFWSLLRESWNIYTGRFGTFLALALIIASPQLAVLLFGFIQNIPGLAVISALPAFLLAIIYIIIYIIGTMWGTAALLFAIKDRAERISVEESFKRSQDKVMSWWWISILSIFIISAGFFMLIIPGILFAVWYSFAAIVLVAEGAKGMSALRKSKEYVRGRFDEIFVRFLLLGLLYVPIILLGLLLKVIPGSLGLIIQQVAGLVFPLVYTPLLLIFQFVLYEKLKSLHDAGVAPIRQGIRGILGIFVLCFVIIAFLGLITVPVVLSSLNAARLKGRDAVRKSNILVLSSDLELYSITKNTYPSSLDDLVTDGEIASLPLDPSTHESYQYNVTPDFQSYKICATLEGVPGGDHQYCENDSLASSTPAVQAQNTVASSSQTIIGKEPYVNTKYAYSIKLPQGWLSPTPDMLPSDSAMAIPADVVYSHTTSNYITVRVLSLSEISGWSACVSLDSCTKSEMAYVTNGHSTNTTVGSVDARLLEYSDGGTHILELLVVKNDYIYKVSAYFDSSDAWQKYEQVIRSSINSFTFTN